MDNNWLNLLVDNIANTSLLEVFGVVFGLLSVIYAKKEHVFVFPTGIISVLIYVYLCFNVKLYADMAINAFYFIMSLYGWYRWTHVNGKTKNRTISRTNNYQKLYLSISFIISFYIIWFVLENYTDSNVALIDSLTTSIFIIGMWLMALKKIENWTLWIIGDFISIPLYIFKGLMLTSIQYMVFLVIAIFGYISWRRSFEEIDYNKVSL